MNDFSFVRRTPSCSNRCFHILDNLYDERKISVQSAFEVRTFRTREVILLMLADCADVFSECSNVLVNRIGFSLSDGGNKLRQERLERTSVANG